jgi:hypothetical protein
VAALLTAGVLVAPIVILGSGSSTAPCAALLHYQGRTYDVRRVTGAVQAVAIGVGVERGCGAPAQNVDVRSLTGIDPSAAIAVADESGSIYVRRGICPSVAGSALLACLRGLP